MKSPITKQRARRLTEFFDHRPGGTKSTVQYSPCDSNSTELMLVAYPNYYVISHSS